MLKRIALVACLFLGCGQLAHAAVATRYRLNETSGTTADADPGTDGTYANDASTTTTAGPNAVVPLATNFVPAATDAVTISNVSLGVAGVSAGSIAFLFNDDTSASNWMGVNGINGQSIRKTNATTVVVDDTTFTVGSISTGVWHLCVVTRSAANSTIVYIDGAATSAQSETSGITPTRIGLRNATYYDGRMAEVREYDHELSQSEVTALYAELLSIQAPRSMHQYRMRRVSLRGVDLFLACLPVGLR